MSPEGYDVIGDVHGSWDALERLLRNLGYSERSGVWRHQTRVAVFVGDLIDTGTQQGEVVRAVRAMHEAGTALVTMGNHEWNAIGWTTLSSASDDGWARTHDRNHTHQHSNFLAQLGEGSAVHRDAIQWFSTFPLWLDLAGLRVIHAYWSDIAIGTLRTAMGASTSVTSELIVEGSTQPDGYTPWDGTAPMKVYDAVGTILNGLEVCLPEGLDFLDKNGHRRRQARIAWWRDEPRTFRNASLVDDEALRQHLPDEPIPTVIEPSDIPVIVGHYWNRGPIGPVAAGSKVVGCNVPWMERATPGWIWQSIFWCQCRSVCRFVDRVGLQCINDESTGDEGF
jgi:Calcineurin-like phosphoesterase